MPNDIYNDVTLEGSTDDVRAFMALVRRGTSVFSFEGISPYPEHFRAMDKESRLIEDDSGLSDDQRKTLSLAYEAKWGTTASGFNAGGFAWCCDNWGTKWNTYQQQLWTLGGVDEDGAITEEGRSTGRAKVRYRFQTAWAPPIPIFLKLIELFPHVAFHCEWEDPILEFSGGMSCRGKDGTARSHLLKWGSESHEDE